MSEVAPVNTGAVTWPEPTLAYFAVRKMQIKLHHWAGADASRRFGDLQRGRVHRRLQRRCDLLPLPR